MADAAPKKSVADGGATSPVPVRCRQSGFRAAIPAADWNSYTQAQRDAYEITKG